MHVENPRPVSRREQRKIEKHEAKRNMTPQQKRKRRIRNTLISVGAVVAVIAIGAGVMYTLAQSWYEQVEKVSIAADPDLERPEASDSDAINILLLGSDSRQTTTSSTGFRSDTIMVAQVSPDRKNVTIMSIMRDNWVEIQGHGSAKINAAFSYGGVPLAVNTVENFIDARIDHVMIVDFTSFKGLTDALGGVTVTNTVAFTSGENGTFFDEGTIQLKNGKQALDFVRERHAFADGDYQRVRNQQAFMKGLIQGILNRDTLSNPGKILATANALQPYLVVDDGLTMTRVADLGFQMKSLRGSNVTFFTSPTLGTGRSADGQSIVIPDEAELANVRAAFRAGTLNEYAEKKSLVTATAQ